MRLRSAKRTLSGASWHGGTSGRSAPGGREIRTDRVVVVRAHRGCSCPVGLPRRVAAWGCVKVLGSKKFAPSVPARKKDTRARKGRGVRQTVTAAAV
ncbi:hypothetical protein A4R44_05015 [Amycolatopsis sp. M39]|nr:hypothetical protein A4R44_05015 [Amycolatopsis sp. M39]